MESILHFLRDLRKNNNRDWFHTHKKRYEKECKEPFRAFVQALIDEVKKVDPTVQIAPKDAIFRIARDIRFSKDKTPYKTNVSAFISAQGRKGKSLPGWYFHLEPGRLMIGGGSYSIERAMLDHVWNKIALEHQRFRSIIEDQIFVNHFEQVRGDKYKRVSKELKSFAATEPLVANKQYFYMAEMPGDTIAREDITHYTMQFFKAGKPLNDFLAEAMGK